MNPIELGKFIATLRNEKNLTQEELAEKLFIDKRKISRWECGNSVPEFDMLIKLSEILDVSLYELSICQRIENEHLSKRILNKFKTIKDFNKYKTIKKIKTIALIIFFILFIITTTYTIKYNNTAEIYKLESLDENYYIEGNYITTNSYSLFYIKDINYTKDGKKNNSIIYNKCEYLIYDNNIQKIYMTNNNSSYLEIPIYEVEYKKDLSSTVNLEINCVNNKNKNSNYSFKVSLKNIYNNQLF